MPNTEPQITVVNYIDEDFDEVKAVWEECGLFYGECDKRESLRKKIQQDPESIIVVKSGGRIVGAVVIIFDFYISYVYRLGVLPQYRHRGIGKILAEEALERLRRKGANSACFFVNPGNSLMLNACSQYGGLENYGPFVYWAKFL
ncbi:MAG: GNAT family N-acetyltransferase [Candidatus Buchananbacteria bacterium]